MAMKLPLNRSRMRQDYVTGKHGRLKSAPNSWFWRHRIVTLLAANVFLLLIVGLAFEVALRVVSPNWLEYRMAFLARGGNIDAFGTDRSWKTVRDNGRFLSFEPHSKFDVVHAEYQNIAFIDEFGGRQVTPQLNSDRLLPCLGDSFTFGVGVENGETFVDHLQKFVGVRSGVRLVNLGVPGTALPEQRFIVDKRHEDFPSPPIYYLVFFFLGNDFAETLQRSRTQQIRTGEKSAWQNLSEVVNDYVVTGWLRHSYAIQFSKRTLMQITNDTRRNPIFSMMEVANTSYHRRVREALQSELEAWGKIAERDQFGIVVIFIPDSYQVISERRERQARYYRMEPDELDAYLPNRILAETLEEQGIRYVDPTKDFMEMHDTERLYYVNDDHFTAKGHYRFAQVIHDELDAALSEFRDSILSEEKDMHD